jgi:hypothetical protein
MVIKNFDKLDGFIITTTKSNVKITTSNMTFVEDGEPYQKRIRTYMATADVFDLGVNNGYSFPKERWDMHLITPCYEVGYVEAIKIVLKEQQSSNEIHHIGHVSDIKTIENFKHLLVGIFTKQHYN